MITRPHYPTNMKITIPDYKLPSWNTIYSSNNWRIRKRIADKVHGMIGMYCLGKSMFEEKVDISITCYYKDKRKRDSDNCTSKLAIDSLKGKIIKDDDTKYVGKVTTEAIIGARTNKVVLIIKKGKICYKY